MSMRSSATEYLARPFSSEHVLTVVQRYIREDLAMDADSADLLRVTLRRIGCYSSAVLNLAQRAAKTNSSMLIVGEQGTGKELLAEAIHNSSGRALGPFVVVNVAAMRESPLEAQLFGRVTETASACHEGRLEAAHRGTILIDQVGEVPATVQARLLQLLEKGIIAPCESSEDRPIDVRLIAASNGELQPLVAAGDFREDLYHRLSVLVIRLTPLRERREDILPTVAYHLEELCRANQMPLVSVDAELARWLEHHAWPGNVRQLSNCLERMVMTARGRELTLGDLPGDLFESPFHEAFSAPPATGEVLSELERTVTLRTLQQYDGNRTRAAESLGISVRTLQRRLKEWGYHDPSPMH
jgi:DNA-binding NtrC family response regulator